ncbi:MAG: hypothetical protein RB191_12900 [Terriglobia bacterium]|nr:hypothetical protein [Terriglobia bacterium]
MRKLLTALLILFTLPAWALPALVQQKQANASSSAGVTTASLAVVLTAPATVGNAIGVGIVMSGSSTVTITGVADDKGNIYAINSQGWSSGSFQGAGTATFVNLANAPQTITVSYSIVSSGTIYMSAHAYEISGATAVDTPSAANGQTSASTALAASFTTATANEFAIAALGNNNSGASYSTNGWTNDLNGGSESDYYWHVSLSGSGANSLTATASAAVSSRWAIVALKAGGASCTNNFWSSAGAYAIPNGTTGSYRNVGTGAFSTPDCSTGSYWLKSGAKGST